MITAAIRYAKTPGPLNTMIAHISRTSVASTFRNSPIPPHTPQIIRFLSERYNFLASIVSPFCILALLYETFSRKQSLGFYFYSVTAIAPLFLASSSIKNPALFPEMLFSSFPSRVICGRLMTPFSHSSSHV